MSLIDDFLKEPDPIVTVGFLDEGENTPSRLDIGFRNGYGYEIEGVSREMYEQLRDHANQSTFFTMELFPKYKDKAIVIKPQ